MNDHLHRGDANAVETAVAEREKRGSVAGNDELAQRAFEARKQWSVGGGVDAATTSAYAPRTDDDSLASEGVLAARRGPPAPRASSRAAEPSWLAPDRETTAQLAPEPTWWPASGR